MKIRSQVGMVLNLDKCTKSSPWLPHLFSYL